MSNRTGMMMIYAASERAFNIAMYRALKPIYGMTDTAYIIQNYFEKIDKGAQTEVWFKVESTIYLKQAGLS